MDWQSDHTVDVPACEDGECSGRGMRSRECEDEKEEECLASCAILSLWLLILMGSGCSSQDNVLRTQHRIVTRRVGNFTFQQYGEL